MVNQLNKEIDGLKKLSGISLKSKD
jgi:hypothetical protein